MEELNKYDLIAEIVESMFEAANEDDIKDAFICFHSEKLEYLTYKQIQERHKALVNEKA